MHILAGAVAGAIIGAVLTAASGGDAKQIAIAAASGAVAGAITACTFGIGTGASMGTMVAVNSLKGAASSVVSDLVSCGLQGKAIDGKQLAVDAVVGGFTGGLMTKAKVPIQNNNLLKKMNNYVETKTYTGLKKVISSSQSEVKDTRIALEFTKYTSVQLNQLETKAISKGVSISSRASASFAIAIASGVPIVHMNAYRGI